MRMALNEVQDRFGLDLSALGADPFGDAGYDGSNAEYMEVDGDGGDHAIDMGDGQSADDAEGDGGEDGPQQDDEDESTNTVDVGQQYRSYSERLRSLADTNLADTNQSADTCPYLQTQGRDAKFYMEHLQKPLYPGAALTVIGACYVLDTEKVEGRMCDKTVDRLCRYLSEKVLPKGNLHPPSFYILKKCMRVLDAVEFEQHVCPNETVGGALTKSENSACELGVDFFQPFSFKTHS
jgi:hypothetical protein